MRRHATAAALIACLALPGFAQEWPVDVTWQLEQVDGVPFTAQATLTVTGEGQIAGQAPCNRYSGALTSDFPKFSTGPLMATKMACPELQTEDIFFAALEEMTEVDISSGVLTLSGAGGRTMLFTAAD